MFVPCKRKGSRQISALPVMFQWCMHVHACAPHAMRTLTHTHNNMHACTNTLMNAKRCNPLPCLMYRSYTLLNESQDDMEELINDKDEELGPEDLEAGQAAAAYRCAPFHERASGCDCVVAPYGLPEHEHAMSCGCIVATWTHGGMQRGTEFQCTLRSAVGGQLCFCAATVLHSPVPPSLCRTTPPHDGLPLGCAVVCRAVNRQADDRTEEEWAKYIEERYKWVTSTNRLTTQPTIPLIALHATASFGRRPHDPCIFVALRHVYTVAR